MRLHLPLEAPIGHVQFSFVLSYIYQIDTVLSMIRTNFTCPSFTEVSLSHDLHTASIHHPPLLPNAPGELALISAPFICALVYHRPRVGSHNLVFVVEYYAFSYSFLSYFAKDSYLLRVANRSFQPCWRLFCFTAKPRLVLLIFFLQLFQNLLFFSHCTSKRHGGQ